jgi:rhamnosyltransferase
MGAEVLSIDRASFNHGSTREMARKRLGTDIVVMLTQDAEPACQELIDRLVAPIESGLAVVAYGRQLPRNGSGLFESFPREFNYIDRSHVRSIADLGSLGSFTFFCSNSCAAYRNEALDRVGGFERVLTAEDTLVAAKLLRAGGRIAYVAEAAVRHSHDYSLCQEFRRYFDTGYVRSCHPEVFMLGSDQRRGNSYSRQFLAAVVRNRPALIVYAVAVIASKAAGYYLGRVGRHLPKPVCARFSLNPVYWRR